MKELSKEQIKLSAKALRQYLKEKHNIDLKHGHCLDALSKVMGYNDWNTTSALSSNIANKDIAHVKQYANINNEKPITANPKTVGEVIDLLSLFNRDISCYQ